MHSRFKIVHKNKRRYGNFTLGFPQEPSTLKVVTIDTFHGHCTFKLSKMLSLTFRCIRYFQALTVESRFYS